MRNPVHDETGFNDQADAWAWMTDRIITVVVTVEGHHRVAAMLSMPEAREFLNTLTAEIAKVDSRGVHSTPYMEQLID